MPFYANPETTILSTSSLGLLGLGAQPPVPSLQLQLQLRLITSSYGRDQFSHRSRGSGCLRILERKSPKSGGLSLANR